MWYNQMSLPSLPVASTSYLYSPCTVKEECLCCIMRHADCKQNEHVNTYVASRCYTLSCHQIHTECKLQVMRPVVRLSTSSFQ